MNIVIINNLPRFPDPRRWDFDLVCYEQFVSHTSNTVTYVANERGVSGVTAEPGSYTLYRLEDLSDAAAYEPLLDEVVRTHGAIDRLIAFAESLQDAAAQLRERYNIPGNRPEQNRLGRNKLVMKQRVQAAGLRAPRYRSVTNLQLQDALDFAADGGFPLILKPIDGHSSKGVRKLANSEELREAILALPAGIEHDLEEFIDGEMFHVDGLINADGQVVFILPSRYVNGGLDFELGEPYGSVTLDPVTQSELYRALTVFATQCVDAIGLRHGAFHMELFQSFNGKLVFIEVAARIPGADAPWMIHKSTGVNLFGEWLNMIMGRPLQIEPRTGATGAWVMFPRPGGLPRRVAAVSRFLGRLPSVYRELVPEAGSVLEQEQGYCSMQAGRFLFCADSAEQVNRDVLQVLSEFSISTVALDSQPHESERTAITAKKALLLLAHQGRGYFAAIQQSLHELGVACLVLSSKPRDAHDQEDLVRLAIERLWLVEEPNLEERHVALVLEEAKAEGYEIVAALATFEGYRRLMAATNHKLGAKDPEPADVVRCMDKYLCRRHLFERGLSHSNAVVLDADTLAVLRADSQPRFVKPRRGAGSFACFRLGADLTIDKLHELQQQMRNDVWLNAMFLGQFDFIAEDYIPGDEYSFEVLVLSGESYVIGVHAKYLCEGGGTTLEVSNSCPAPRLSDAQELAGEQYVARCLRALKMTSGCYHIETRFDPRNDSWDIIEINARMGGALINQSIGVFTGGPTLLDLWIRVLCSGSAAEIAALHSKLSALRESARRANKEIIHGSVFFTRYGERNRTVEHISIAGMPRQPDIYDIPVRAGSKLPDSQRGIFILNALWKVDVDQIAQELSELSAMVDDSLVIRYAGVPARRIENTGEIDMNRVTRCGIERPAPFFSLQDGERIRAKLDSYLDKQMAVWAATVPYANHLESKDLNTAWYRRHTIEHVWRIRLSRAAHTRALHEIAKISPEAAQLYGQYQAEEMNHDLLFMQDCKAIGVTEEELLSTEPFLATRLLQGFFYFICEHEHPMGVVASSYLVEYTTAKLTPRHIRALRESLGEEKIKGQLAHINTDLGDDHVGEMWRILRYLLNSEADVEKVLRYFDDIKEIVAMYFRELYEATVAPSKAA